MLSNFNVWLFNIIVGIVLLVLLYVVLACIVGFLKVVKEEKIKDEREKTKKINLKNNEND